MIEPTITMGQATIAMARTSVVLGWRSFSPETQSQLVRVFAKYGRPVEIATLAGYCGA